MTDELELANSSGFPLQLAIESSIASGTSRHGWRVSSHEHPWSHGNDSGFADIVLEEGNEGLVRIVLECKKRAGALMFFAAVAAARETARCRVRWGYRTAKKAFEGGWVDVNIAPASIESEFCIVRGEGAQKQNTMLESIAHDVVQAAEGICKEELLVSEREAMGSARVYVPVVVTTAKLFVCHMDPEAVDLKTGHLEPVPKSATRFMFVQRVQALMV
jgi:hypothetical protein